MKSPTSPVDFVWRGLKIPPHSMAMPSGPPDPKQLGYYYALAQVGAEMAAPIGLGWLLDSWLGWFPWLTSTGAILGLVLGLVHLIKLVNKPPKDESK